MIRAFIFFAVFTIATTAPLHDDDLIKLRKNIAMNSLIMEQSEENEIPENKPLNNVMIHNRANGEVDVKSKDTAYNNNVHVETTSINDRFMKTDYLDSSENEDYNFINSHQRIKPESELSVFITVLEEFMKSIAEQLIKMYKH